MKILKVILFIFSVLMSAFLFYLESGGPYGMTPITFYICISPIILMLPALMYPPDD